MQVDGPQPHALPIFCGQRHKLFRREVTCDFAVFKVNNAVCHIREVIEPMLCNDHGLALRLDQPKVFLQLAVRCHIKIGGRLIQQIDLRIHGIDRGECDLLLFAAGESKDIAAQQVFDAERPGRLCHTPFHPLLWDCLIFHTERDLAIGVHIEKLRPGILKHTAHLFRNLIHGQLGKIFTVKQNFSTQFTGKELRNQAVDEPCQCGFPAAAPST